MTETVTTVDGGLTVAALFNNCVACFDYVQLGRRLGPDYERCQLKVDIAQTRLSRWGKAVSINEDPRFATETPADVPMQHVYSILEEIQLRFGEAQKIAKRHARTAKPEDLSLRPVGDMQVSMLRLHQRLTTIVHQGQRQMSLKKKPLWAFYDGKQLDRFVDQISESLDDLEVTWPSEAGCRQLAEKEVEEVDNASALATIQDAAANIDRILAGAAKLKAEEVGGNQNHVGKIVVKDGARVRVGDEIGQNFVGCEGMTVHTNNSADVLEVDGPKSRVHIGSSYGGRSIFDD